MRRALIPLFLVSLSARAQDTPLPPPPRLGEPQIAVGALESETLTVALLPHAPRMQACASTPMPAVSQGKPGALPTGQITFQVRLRRGKATLAVASTTEPGLEWITPCLERVLVDVAWPMRRGAFEVPVVVEPAAAPVE